MEDGSLANVEVQKIGYSFPGQRSACYSADMLLRQYKRTRARKKKNFNYRDIKDVYTIILFEKSASEFHAFPNAYVHFFEQHSDTGLNLPLLQKFLFVPLDIFLKNQHNKSINSKLDAWLLFFSSDNPEDIMGFFSEELRILDRNTVQYMMDEMQEDLDRKKEELAQVATKLTQTKDELDQAKTELAQALKRIKELESK